MNMIYKCNCGCGREIWKDGDTALYLFMGNTCNMKNQAVLITHVEGQFVNGNWSMPPDATDIIKFELGFQTEDGLELTHGEIITAEEFKEMKLKHEKADKNFLERN